MIQLTAQMRILVALEPVDFRKRIDGLAALCRSVLTSDPFSGTVFVFCSRRRRRYGCSLTMAKVSGCAKNVCRRGVSASGLTQ